MWKGIGLSYLLISAKIATFTKSVVVDIVDVIIINRGSAHVILPLPVLCDSDGDMCFIGLC